MAWNLTDRIKHLWRKPADNVVSFEQTTTGPLHYLLDHMGNYSGRIADLLEDDAETLVARYDAAVQNNAAMKSYLAELRNQGSAEKITQLQDYVFSGPDGSQLGSMGAYLRLAELTHRVPALRKDFDRSFTFLNDSHDKLLLLKSYLQHQHYERQAQEEPAPQFPAEQDLVLSA